MKMAFAGQIKEFLINRVGLFVIGVICLHPDSTIGNSVVELREPSGEFQSPGYPILDNDVHCTWKIIPPQHTITITFLEFDLEERYFCIDEVEVHDGNATRSTYTGRQLYQQSITSTSNTMSVVLTSCSISFFSRRGIRVSYSTVYPTTSPYQTSKKEDTKQRPTATKETFSIKIDSTMSNVLNSTPTVLSSTEYIGKLPLAGSTGQELLYTLLGALLSAVVVAVIVVVLIVKRRKAKTSKNTTTPSRNINTNQEQGYITTVDTERISETSLDHRYVDLNKTGKDMNSVYYSRGIVSENLDSSMLQKEHSNLDTSNDIGVYENSTSNIHSKPGDEQYYSNIVHKVQLSTPKISKKDK